MPIINYLPEIERETDNSQFVFLKFSKRKKWKSCCEQNATVTVSTGPRLRNVVTYFLNSNSDKDFGHNGTYAPDLIIHPIVPLSFEIPLRELREYVSEHSWIGYLSM